MFQEKLWQEWETLESQKYVIIKRDGHNRRKYLKKGYLHFDNRVWFPEKKEAIKRLLADPAKIATHQFTPFIKLIVKTPRYKKLAKGTLTTKGKDFQIKSKPRPLCYASHLDALILGYYAYALNKNYESYLHESELSDSVLAYRTDTGKCNIQFAGEAFDLIRSNPNLVAIAIDIKGYFNHIDHAILKSKWEQVIGSKLPDDQYKIFKTVTRYSYCGKNNILAHFKIDLDNIEQHPNNLMQLLPGRNTSSKYDYLKKKGLLIFNDVESKLSGRKIGIPQGSPISAVLSNIYLMDFDKEMHLLSKSVQFTYRRYCDDILILCHYTDLEAILSEIKTKLTDDYYLSINPDKLEIVGFKLNHKSKLRSYSLLDENANLLTIENAQKYKTLQYLGFEFNGQSILIRPSSLSRYFRRMKTRIQKVVSMAYGKHQRGKKLFTSRLLHRYTHLGKRNFISYAYNAASKAYVGANGITMDGLNSSAIRRQLSRHTRILKNALFYKNLNRHTYKARAGKTSTFKGVKNDVDIF